MLVHPGHMTQNTGLFGDRFVYSSENRFPVYVKIYIILAAIFVYWRMTVTYANGRYPSEHVQIPIAPVIEQPLHFALV